MNVDLLVKMVESLAVNAAEADDADDALKLSQAACNIANAMAQTQNVEACCPKG